MDFFQEFRKLAFSLPRVSTHNRASQNCDFSDFVSRSKNIYLSFFVNDAEDCYYSGHLMKCRDCVDSSYLSACELCYECVDCTNLYNCSFLQDSHQCSNCDYSYDLLHCKDCFGSFGLRNQQFRIFNKPYSEDDYRKKIHDLKKQPAAKILEALRPEFDKHPRLFSRLLKGDERCFGDYIYFSKNCYLCYNVRNIENAAYASNIMDPEFSSSDIFDCNFGSNLHLCYECQNVFASSNCNFLENCANCADCEYAIFCYNCRNCFGCAYMMNKEYCILNRPFSREEYLALLKKIKGELKVAGLYGKPLAEILKRE